MCTWLGSGGSGLGGGDGGGGEFDLLPYTLRGQYKIK